ncbi:MAG: DUF6261 family protein [Bradymonadaceae bacterium]
MEKLETLTAAELLSALYKPTIGSIRFSLGQVTKMVGPAPNHIVDDPLVRIRLDRAIGHIEAANEVRFQWESKKRHEPLRRRGAAEADNVADRAMRNLYDSIESFIRLSPSNPLHRTATELRHMVMPEGVGVITTKRFEDQHSATDVVLRILDTDGAPAVQALNLEPFVEEVRAANRAYGEALISRETEGVTYDQVQAAYSEALNSFFGVVLAIWNGYFDDGATRNQLLQPIYEQNVRFQRYYRRRSTAPQVDPATGEFIDPEVGDTDADFGGEVVEPAPQPVVEDA